MLIPGKANFRRKVLLTEPVGTFERHHLACNAGTTTSSFMEDSQQMPVSQACQKRGNAHDMKTAPGLLVRTSFLDSLTYVRFMTVCVLCDRGWCSYYAS
jgi:hypothetical protein